MSSTTPRLDEPLMQIRNLDKSFGGVKAVDNVTMDLRAGIVTTLVGPNGAGKTTFFNLITGNLARDGGEVTWTSPHPRGVGATRTVQIGPLVVDETFLAWTPHRLAFRVDHATTGLLAAFAEDWRVVPGAPGHCIVRWTVALELRGAARALQPAMPAVFRLAGLGVLHQLAGYLEARAAR